MTNPLRCLGEMLATFVGRALGGAFFLLGKARQEALHPRGEVLEGMIGRRGAVGRTGVAWLDEAGTDHVAVRLSRSLGLPDPRPDILGMALRIATNLASSVMCFWRRPEQDCSAICSCRHAGMDCAPTSLFPSRTLAGPLLLAAIPTAGSPRRYELAYARPTGPWLPSRHWR